MIKREERPLGLNIGSASIIMIFAILCLTVFSALSLVTSVSEKKTAQRFADETAAYYEADSEAVKIKNSIPGPGSAGASPNTLPDAIITYNVPLSDNISRITAVLTYNSKTNTLETLSWEKNNISEWSPDTDIDVWNGEDDPAENVTE